MKKIKKKLLVVIVLQSINLLIFIPILTFITGKVSIFLLLLNTAWNLLILVLLIKLYTQIYETYKQIINLGNSLGLPYSKKQEYAFTAVIQNTKSILKEMKDRDHLRKSLISTLMENLNLGILIFNDKKVVTANSILYNIFKISNLISKDISHVFLPEHRNIFLCIETAQKQNKKTECKATIYGKKFEITIIPVESENQLFLAIFSERTLEYNMSRIKRALIENISHELRTPLTIIKGYAEALEEEGADKEFVKKIKSGVEEIENISRNINLLLDVESEQNINLRYINLEEICNKLYVKFAKLSNDKGLDFEIQCNLKMCKKPYLDSAAVWTILSNLIDNAIKFTESGKVALYIYDEENHIVFEVTDTGTGIERKHIDRIFERFYRTPEARTKKGHGLGLAIVKHLVTLHRGVIEVKSQKNKGTTLIVKLPCKP